MTRQNPAAKQQQAWRDAVIQYLSAHADHPLKARPLARALRVPDTDYSDFRELLREMLRAGQIEYAAGRTLRLPAVAKSPGDTLIGLFHGTRRGAGFVESPGRPDAFVPKNKTGSAIDGDTVEARLLPRSATHPDLRAEVVRIVARSASAWVGVLQKSRGHWFVVPQGKPGAQPIEIDDPTARAANEGDLVVIEPLEHTLHGRHPKGVIIERLGPLHSSDAKILSVIRQFGIPEEFDPAVREDVRHVTAEFPPPSLNQRADLTGLFTITIDPSDARDFDDAITLEHLPAGRVRLGVHIADVAHFVRPASPLDHSARERSTSVYFPGRVVPMLPEQLSNGLCSLQPDELRLTKSVFIEYDNRGRRGAIQYHNSYIRSDKRLTYDEVTAVLAGQTSGYDDQLVRFLKDADQLARRIRKRRLADGMLVLAIPEVELKLGPDGSVVDAGPADTSFSHTIIEMFMVEANEAVSEGLDARAVAHLRRNHPEPDPDAATGFRRLLRTTGHELSEELDRPAIMAVLNEVKGTPEEPVINYMLLRTFAQAMYSPDPIGHYALASKHYCHFTSPIRRYPDLTIHRLFEAHLADERDPDTDADPLPSDAELAVLGSLTSTAERRAQRAERDAKELLLLEFMATKVGEVLDGVITGVASFGAFVQVRPYLAEGTIAVADFGPDHWLYDERMGAFFGERTRRLVTLGQPVRVRIAAVNQIDRELELVPDDGGPIGAMRTDIEVLSRGRARRTERAGKQKADPKKQKSARGTGSASPKSRSRKAGSQRSQKRGRRR